MKIGILGAGQLGMMLGEAARSLGHEPVFYDPADEAPASKYGTVTRAAWADHHQLQRFAAACDVVTFEFENIPVAAAEVVAATCSLFPQVKALEVAQDRIQEKTFLRTLGIQTARFERVVSAQDLEAHCRDLGLPAILKTCRMGYDGKGQRELRRSTDAQDAWQQLGGQELILEELVPFKRELSQISVRSQSGQIAHFPLCQNEHRGGILRRTLAPAPEVSLSIQHQARQGIELVLRELEYVGVLTIEFFELKDGRLFANEMAPRVHNSGHWTIEGASTSQFAQHIRAVAGQALEPIAVHGHSVMLNVIGQALIPSQVPAAKGVFVHDYGKTPKPGRKLGHVTIQGDDLSTVEHLAIQLVANRSF